MMPDSLLWLDIVTHRARGLRAPYLLILQHHDIATPNRIVAPVTVALPGEVDAFAPRVVVGGNEFRVRMLDLNSFSRRLLAGTVASAADEAEAIMNALDILLHGYPVGRTFAS